MKLREKIEEEVLKRRVGGKADGLTENNTRFFTCHSITCYSSTALLLYAILYVMITFLTDEHLI